MGLEEIRFAQARPEHLPIAAKLCHRIYRGTAIDRAFASPEAILRRWRWIIEGNPTASRLALPVWVALSGQKVVGHFGAIPALADVSGRPTPVAWGRDFFVDASVRGAGVGSGLVETAVRAAGTILVAGLNDRAIRAYKRVGFVDRGPIPFFLLILRPEDVAAVSGRRFPLSLSRLLAEAAAIWGRKDSRFGAQVNEAERFDTRFDEWWSAAAQKRRTLIERTSATMNWRYRGHPSHRYAILELERAGRLAGVAVLRTGVSRGLPAGFLVELLVERGDLDAAQQLVSASVRHLTSGSPTPALIRSNTCGPDLARALIGSGFVPAPSPFRWMIADRKAIDGPVRDMFLNGGDSDLDFI